MLNALEIAQTLIDAGLNREQAAAITNAVQQAAEHGDPATRADLDAAVARLEARNAELEVRLIKWMIGTVLAGASATIAILRFLS